MKKIFFIIWNVFIFLALTFLVLFLIIYVYNNNERIRNLYEDWTNEKKGAKGEKGDKGNDGNKGDKGDDEKDNHGPLITSEEMANREDRGSLTYSKFKPTGYYLEGHNSYTVTLNRSLMDNELGKIKFSIGQWGKYKNINENREDVFMEILISIKTNIVTFSLKINGVLYLADNNQTNLRVTSVVAEKHNGIIKIPTFKVNKTDQTEFIEQVKTTKSPFVEFVAKNYFATMQTDMIKNVVIPRLQHSFNITLNHWDNVWNWSNELLGLNENYTDINKKYTQYIHIVNPDAGGGYASTTVARMIFQNSTSAGQNLFLDKISDQWSLWHETGHSYAIPQYSITEVVNNINSLYIQQKLGIQLRIYKENEKQQAIKENLAQPNEKKDFTKLGGDLGLWTKLGMFWQLHMAFGNNFYPLLNQTYRIINQ